MSTYGGDPVASPRDEVRLLLGDTTEPFDLTDREVDALLEGVGDDTLRAAARGALSLAARYSRAAVDVSNGDVSKSFTTKASAYREMASLYAGAVKDAVTDETREARAAVPIPFAGGLDIPRKFTEGDLTNPRNWDAPGTYYTAPR